MSESRILVTGSSGFIGSALVRKFAGLKGWQVRAAVRQGRQMPGRPESIESPDLGPDADWRVALAGVDVVVHAAGRAHRMSEATGDPMAAFRTVNTTGTLTLAKQAAEAGVRRFIFLSTVKVNGESTLPGRSFRASDHPDPSDPYGISKLEAEKGLQALARDTGMEVTIIRPVLVYGPGVLANFQTMMRWLARGVPLPLGSIHNRRSMVSVDNLVDLVRVCLDHPQAANRVFLVSDLEDLSTTELLQRLGNALGKPPRLVPVPENVLTMVMRLLGRKGMAERLCGSLQVDISDTCRLLDWTPPVKVDDALRETASDFWARV